MRYVLTFLLGLILCYAVMIWQPIRDFAYSWQNQFEQAVEQTQQDDAQQDVQEST